MAKAIGLQVRAQSKVTEYPVSATVTQVTAATTDTCVLTHPIVTVNSAAGAVTTFTVPDGEPGQMLTLILGHANDVDVIPTTTYGFVSIALDTIGDQAILSYIDDTTGWIIISLNGTAAGAAPAFSLT